MPDSVITQRTFKIEHVTIVSRKDFETVKAALEKLLPRFDSSVLVLLRYGESARAKKELERTPGLAIFFSRDHGGLLQIVAQRKKALQYEIGNPLTALTMTQHRLSASLYAPLRVLLYENTEGHAVFEYDKPSSLFGQFGDKEVSVVGRDLDQKLEDALRRAAK